MSESLHLIRKNVTRQNATDWKKKLMWQIPLCISIVFCLVTLSFISKASDGKTSGGNIDKAQSLQISNNESSVSDSVETKRRSNIGRYSHAAVAADTPDCANIGSNLLAKRGASTVDAAIATLLCTGLQNAHSSGIGGGSVFLIYDVPKGGKEKELVSLDSRETAPAAAKPNMFMDGNISSSTGGLSVAVPGAIRGYYEAWKRFGRLPWAELFQPAIQMTRYGFPCSEDMADKLHRKFSNKIESMDPELRSVYVTKDGNLVKEGDMIHMPKLATTLDIIAETGADVFYTGSLTTDIIQDIQEKGGIITTEDLQKYTPVWRTPTKSFLPSKNWTMYSPPAPFSGPVLQFILHVLEGYNLSSENLKTQDATVLTYHRIIEAFKFAYASRTYLGDPAYEDVSEVVKNLTSVKFADYIRSRIDSRTHNVSYYEAYFESAPEGGTCHLNFLGTDGSVVSVTDTINIWFGALFAGRRTGIIFNDEMVDFSKPTSRSQIKAESPVNNIKPGKRPLSSMTPTLMLDESGTARLIIGASGGTHIIAQTAFVAAHHLWLGKSLRDSVDVPRLHHQLNPNKVKYELGVPEFILDGLRQKGHVVQQESDLGFVQAIHNYCSLGHRPGHSQKHCIEAVSDQRKGGRPAGF